MVQFEWTSDNWDDTLQFYKYCLSYQNRTYVFMIQDDKKS